MGPRSLFKDYGNQQKQKPRDDIKQVLLDVTLNHMNEMDHRSVFFRRNPPRPLASFQPSEVQVDKTVGMGEFGVVMEVANITLDRTPPSPPHFEYDMEAAMPPSLRNSKSCTALPLLVRKPPKQPVCPSVDASDSSDSSHSSESTVAWSTRSSSLSSHGNTEHDLENKQELREEIASLLTREVHNNNQPESNGKASQPQRRRRYAVKQLRKDLYPQNKIEAGKDLAREAKFLASLEHPNVIRLRGTVGQPGYDDFMIVLDRLGISLKEQLTSWKEQLRISEKESRPLFPWQVSSQHKAHEQSVLLERLLALFDITQAMTYLHRHSILFRDLKTENVSRNHHGAFQLLDFGLAKEVKARDRVHPPNAENSVDFEDIANDVYRGRHEESSGDLYKLTGLTGTLRIMSPEVIQCQPYGLSADVYSFGIVVWEVFAGDTNRLPAAEICKGERPSLPVEGMPDRVNSLVRKCNGDAKMRPTFAMLCQEMEYQLLELQEVLDDCTCNEVWIQNHSSLFDRFDFLRQLSLQSMTAPPAVEPC